MEDILTVLASKAQRILIWTAVLFLASAAFHALVWFSVGMPSLDGPISWRKPITFGFSSGVLCLSLSWVLGLLPQTPRLVRQASLFSALLITEVALIDMQQWRGVASHFNATTAFDAAVFSTMGVLIMAVSVVIGLWTIALFRRALPTSRSLALAARAGMVMLNIGNLIGVLMAATESTALKPLHGAALHAIQVLPVLALAAAWLRYPRAWRDDYRSVRWLSSSGWGPR